MTDRLTHQKFQVVAGAFMTTALSAYSILGYSFGVLLPDLQREFGWDRGSASSAMTLLSCGIFVSGILGGRLADKFGTMTVAIVSAMLCTMAMMLFPLAISSVFAFCVCYFVIGILCVGLLPITLLRPIGRLFTKRRGFATGLVLSGTGVSGIFVPIVTNVFVEKGGWQLGYIGSSLFIFITIPILWLTLGQYSKSEQNGFSDVDPAVDLPPVEGITLKAARRTKTLWMLTAISLLVGMCFAGIVVHLVLAFRDMGATASHASTLAAVIGFSAIIGRLFTGILLDRVNGPALGAITLVAAAGGFAIARFFGLEGAALGAALIGFGYGSEYDLIAYYVGRYFGLMEFGSIYGWLYGFIALGNAIGPLIVGMMYDHFGSYKFALDIATGIICLAAVLTISLGKYRYSVQVSASGS
jgi:MFS family permease